MVYIPRTVGPSFIFSVKSRQCLNNTARFQFSAVQIAVSSKINSKKIKIQQNVSKKTNGQVI